MRTRLTIVGIVLVAAAAAVGVVVLLAVLLGAPAGLAASVLGAAAVPGLAGAVPDRVAHGTSVAPGRRVRYLRRRRRSACR